MCHFKQVFLLSLVISVSLNARIVEENQVRILKIRDCPNTNYPIKYNTSVQQVGKGSLVIFGRISLTEDVKNITLVYYKIFTRYNLLWHAGRKGANGYWLRKARPPFLSIRNRSLEVKLHKCGSYSATETCEYFTTCKYQNPCPFIAARKQVWSSFVDSIHPPMRCPFKKGTYIIQNASFDTSFMKSVAGMNGMYWDIKVKMYVEKKCVTCFEIGIDFRKIRRKIH